MALRATDGSTLTVSIDIIDDNDSPVVPRPGFPKVVILDKDKSVMAQFSATPGSSVGQWDAVLHLPLLGVTQATEYKVQWRCIDMAGDRYKLQDMLIVDPKADRRDSEVVVFADDTTAEFVMPIAYKASMNAVYQVYRNNAPVLPGWVPFSDPTVAVDAGMDRTVVSVPVADLQPALFANLLSVRATVQGSPRVYQYKYWCITPQIALAMTMVEDFLNKSRIENVIPELEYSAGDLVGYLERGLNMFNSLVIVTAFTGTNMQGPLLDGWIVCSTYWALGAQLLAEGSLAFDFSGQGISLNVDRTPQLDAALGRIEARIQDTVVPLKKLVGQQGILGGDGSAGSGSLHNPYSSGTLSLINASTTRVNGWSNYTGFRSRS